MKAKNFIQNRQVAREGGSIAGTARRKLEKKTGKKAITKLNAKGLKLIK